MNIQTIRIGASSLEVPALGVGTWAWGDKLTWQYGVSYGKQDVVAAFHASLRAGLRLFDTAEVYGTCLLYTSDAADERSSVDLGGRRIIKKKHIK
mgnify:CR=1 FL=1